MAISILTERIKTAIVRADNAAKEIDTAAVQIAESDSSSAEQREDIRAIQKALKHLENVLEDIRIISANL